MTASFDDEKIARLPDPEEDLKHPSRYEGAYQDQPGRPVEAVAW